MIIKEILRKLKILMYKKIVIKKTLEHFSWFAYKTELLCIVLILTFRCDTS